MDVSADRRLNDGTNTLSVPGAENQAESNKKTSSSKESSSRSKRRDSRSKSPRSRRHRSKSRSYSPSNRGRQRDPRLRGRRSRTPNRGPRSPPRSRKSGSRERYRGSNRRNWSPRKKGPVSPPPIQQVNHGFNMPPPQIYTDGYNYPPQSYPPPAQPYAPYDYTMQAQPSFNAYPNQAVMQPVPPGDDFQQSNWGHPTHMAIPPPTLVIPPPIQQVPVETEEEKSKREAAVAKEKKTQRATLGKQREDYKRRATALKRELNTLKEQRDDLISGSEPPSPTTKGFIKENDRLQLQIENKITSIENVIDMLTNIIGADASPTPSPPPPPTPVKSKKDKKKKSNSFSDDDSSPERLKSKALESLKRKKGNDLKVAELRNDDDVNEMSVDDKYKSMQKINYVHYDPQMHWCKQCNIFPKTAKDFLIHLHSKEHQETQKIVEPPWHDKLVNDEMPHYPDASTKRTPIRGLQFFVPTTGWYCTICSVWMGDLHCASLHLKSKTHANQYNDYNSLNPHFEVDWVGERHKAYEDSRQKNPLANADRPTQQQTPIVPIPMPVPPPTLTMEQEVIEGIPLQLQIPTTHKLDLDDGKKKKKKKKSDEKKDKKKKKRSKKRRQSSSSSSSSDTSDSEANVPADKNRDDTSHSIRVAMRNLLKQQNEKKLEESGGKWTVVQQAQLTEPVPPVPPTISTNGENDNRRDDLMISQWNAPEPIISEDERKLLEQLKGRLKANSKEREINGRKRSKDRSKDRSKEPKELNESRDRDRDRERDRDRDRNRRRRSSSRSKRTRSRSRERRRRSRSRSRGRFRSRSRSTGRWGRRWSRSRSRSRSRSGRVEKPIVRYPEFRPRVPEKEAEKPDKRRGSKRDQDEPKNGSGSGSKTDSKKTVIVLKNPNANKKLPFIGRMPVFKRHNNEEEMKKIETTSESVETTNYHTYYDGNVQQMPMEDYDDLMPDPMQFVSLMGAAPPPPPMVPPPPTATPVDKNEPVLPPGIDEADADLVRKTISDAPLPRKGPLPQDFQDALSIIFDQKTIPDPETEKINQPEPNADVDSQIIPMQIVDEQSQHTMDLYQASFPLAGIASDADLSFAEDVDIPDPLPLAIPPPPPPQNIEQVDKSIKLVDEDPIVAAKKLEDSALMDDLAMLGIDADDLAAQCI